MERIWGLSFLKMVVTLAVLSASRKTPGWNERFINNVRGCFKSLTWFFRISTGMLHGPKLLLWLRFLMSFSISVSLTGLIKINSKLIFFLGTYQNDFLLWYFRCKVWINIYKKTIKFLSNKSFTCNNISV